MDARSELPVTSHRLHREEGGHGGWVGGRGMGGGSLFAAFPAFAYWRSTSFTRGLWFLKKNATGSVLLSFHSLAHV